MTTTVTTTTATTAAAFTIYLHQSLEHVFQRALASDNEAGHLRDVEGVHGPTS
jgi:hypothetical protein